MVCFEFADQNASAFLAYDFCEARILIASIPNNSVDPLEQLFQGNLGSYFDMNF